MAPKRHLQQGRPIVTPRGQVREGAGVCGREHEEPPDAMASGPGDALVAVCVPGQTGPLLSLHSHNQPSLQLAVPLRLEALKAETVPFYR